MLQILKKKLRNQIDELSLLQKNADSIDVIFSYEKQISNTRDQINKLVKGDSKTNDIKLKYDSDSDSDSDLTPADTPENDYSHSVGSTPDHPRRHNDNKNDLPEQNDHEYPSETEAKQQEELKKQIKDLQASIDRNQAIYDKVIKEGKVSNEVMAKMHKMLFLSKQRLGALEDKIITPEIRKKALLKKIDSQLETLHAEKLEIDQQIEMLNRKRESIEPYTEEQDIANNKSKIDMMEDDQMRLRNMMNDRRARYREQYGVDP